MAFVTVNGVVLWTRNIHGDPRLCTALRLLPAGQEVELVVDGARGHWRKMADGRDGRPTAGLAPKGRMQAFWRELNRTKRGEEVSLGLAEMRNTDLAFQPATAETLEQRAAALKRLLSLDGGRFPDGWRFNRQEVYDDRDDELEARRRRSS